MEEAQRWTVLYTNHVRQKRKVYHDGFLVLHSSSKKVMLYDEWDKLLDTRFVKKDDLIISGETVKFDSYLVDLGEPCQCHQPKPEKGNKVSETSSSFYSQNTQNKRPMVGKSKRRALNLSPSKKFIRDFKTSEMKKFGSSTNCMGVAQLSTKGKQPGDSSEGIHPRLSDSRYKTENSKLNGGDAEPRRSVCDILSILRHPSERKVAPVNKPLSQDCAESLCLEFQSDTKNYINEYSECCGTATEELGENRSEHDGMVKFIKSEPVEVVIDAEERGVSENGRVSQTRSSGSHIRSQLVKSVSPIQVQDEQSTNLEKLMSSPSCMDSHAAATAALSCDGQKEILSEFPTRSYACENPPIICSCEAIMTEANAALENALSSSKLPELQKDKDGSSCRCNNDCTEDMDEFPSFDLGI